MLNNVVVSTQKPKTPLNPCPDFTGNLPHDEIVSTQKPKTPLNPSHFAGNQLHIRQSERRNIKPGYLFPDNILPETHRTRLRNCVSLDVSRTPRLCESLPCGRRGRVRERNNAIMTQRNSRNIWEEVRFISLKGRGNCLSFFSGDLRGRFAT